jgi:hypothetical protein
MLKISSQNIQFEINDNKQETQILNKKKNFHKQRVIDKTQISQRNNVDALLNNALRSFRSEKTSISKNIFKKNIIHIINKMLNAYASKTTRFAKFAL